MSVRVTNVFASPSHLNLGPTGFCVDAANGDASYSVYDLKLQNYTSGNHGTRDHVEDESIILRNSEEYLRPR
jgi:hypothetical protein